MATYLDARAAHVVAQEDAGIRPPCTPLTERCASARWPRVRTRSCCRQWIAAVLRDVAEALDAAGVRWWIDYGTLLGYQIGGGLYWNDKDADLGVLADDREKVLAARAHWEAQGHRVTYLPPRAQRFRSGDRVKVRLSAANTTNVDIFFWRPIAGGLLDRMNYIPVDRYKGREFPAEWALPTTRGTFDGVDVAVPAEPELLVAHRYGADWRHLPAARTDGVRR